MDNPDHSTRTLLLSKIVDDTLLISRGSADNNDAGASILSTGRAQIKAFNLGDLSGSETYDYTSQGTRLGWGLRNSVGVAEHPLTGGIYSVENSVDDAERMGQDVHENNPGEEMNFHGYLNGTRYAAQGGNYGYPICFAAWNASLLPDNSGIETGTQFALGTPNNTVNDDICQNDRIAPRLTFPAHWAPLE
jgi:glucose/arabinose dehydrogenase